MPTRVKAKNEVPDPAQAFAMHERQSWAASVINAHFGQYKDSHPDLWVHRTFMLIVTRVYERLVLCEDISAKEFVDLTKTLVEGYKNKLDEREEEKDESDASSKLGGVVAGLEEMVRQIYGTNLQTADPGPLPSSSAITSQLETGT